MSFIVRLKSKNTKQWQTIKIAMIHENSAVMDAGIDLTFILCVCVPMMSKW